MGVLPVPVVMLAMMPVVLLVMLPVSAAADVRLVDNVYQGLVIGVDERVRPQRCREIIDGVKVGAAQAMRSPLSWSCSVFACKLTSNAPRQRLPRCSESSRELQM